MLLPVLTNVVDTTAPTLAGVPDGIEANATSNETRVAYTPTATDKVTGNVTVTCVPPSGSRFEVGDTNVTCSAVDGAGNRASRSFIVTVGE